MIRRTELLTVALLMVIAYAVFTPMVTFVVRQEVDYRLHQMFIQELLDGIPIGDFLAKVPHFLFHLLTLLVAVLFTGQNLTEAAAVVALSLYLLTALTVYGLLRLWFGRPTSWRMALICAGGTLVMMLVAPINIFTPTNMYLGYITPHAYHNPTMVVLKPLALALFVCAWAALDSTQRLRVPLLVGMAVALLAILAKPSYTITLLPALALTAGWRWLRRGMVDWRLLIGGIGFPSAYLLAVQALVFDTGHFMIAPLALFDELARRINPLANDGLLLKFFLSSLFPLCVYALYFRQARRNVALNLAWLTFAFGAAYTYLLVEGNERLGHGNFWWSGQIALFVLFVASLVFLLAQTRLSQGQAMTAGSTGRADFLRLLVCGGVLGLHLFSGIVWYLAHATAAHMNDLVTKVW